MDAQHARLIAAFTQGHNMICHPRGAPSATVRTHGDCASVLSALPEDGEPVAYRLLPAPALMRRVVVGTLEATSATSWRDMHVCRVSASQAPAREARTERQVRHAYSIAAYLPALGAS